MKKIIAIAPVLILLVLIGRVPIVEQSSSASTATPVPGQVSSPLRQLPGLQSLTFHIQNGIFGGPTPFSFAVNSVELAQRRNDPLSVANRDFMAIEAIEFDDVFYSDADGTFNADGRFVTIESVYNRSDSSGMRLAQVDLNFTGGRVDHFNQVASFVRFGGTAGTERFAVDDDLLTNAQLGNTVGQTGRLRLTLAFVDSNCDYSIQPASVSLPGFFEVGFQSGIFNVSVPDGCQWIVEVEASQPFLNATLPLPATGSRSVAYQVLSNSGSTPRTGRIHVIDVASGEVRQTFTVTQDGFNCPASGYSISPGNVVIERDGGDFSFQVTAPPGCQAGAPSIDVEWMRFITQVDIGGGSVLFFQARSNPGNFRTGTIDTSGQRFFVYQNPQGCPLELICFFFPGACGVPDEFPEIRDGAAALELSRRFRDVKLASTPRGQNYIRLYYQFSSEAVQTMLFNPMLLLRSREIFERYRPALQAMVKGEQVTLTRGDVDEIDSFLDSFAEKGGSDLKAAIRDVRRDLRDPRMHQEFGISLTEGPMRQLPSQDQLQSILRVGGFTTLFGFSLIFACGISRCRRKDIKRGAAITLGVLMIAGQSLVIGSRGAAVPQTATLTADSDPVLPGPAPGQTAKIREKLPITFEVNRGQADPEVRFISRTSGYNLFLGPTEATMQFRTRGVPAEEVSAFDRPAIAQSPGGPVEESNSSLRMKLIGANGDSKLSGVDPRPGRINYFIGKDPARWREGLRTFGGVRSQEVYPGVDMIYYGGKGELEYDFIISPGRDAGVIRLGFEGAESIAIDSRGDLVLQTAAGEVRHRKPVVYQEVDGEKQLIEGRYSLYKSESEEPVTGHSSLVTFEIGSYDSARPLIIDPVLSFSTYLGGNSTDEGNAIAVDAAGNTYVAGFTDSADFPTMNATQPGFGGRQDAFVVKLDPSGRMIYSTYLGGNGQDNATSLAVDPSGNVWVTGFTDSTNFPVRNSFQPNKAGLFNAFVARLDPGGSLASSTHLGGNARDVGSSIVIDASGSVYVAGLATSTNFPLRNPLQATPAGAADLFVSKFNSNGRQLVYSTYLGGAGIDGASSIAVDAAGNLYVTGLTSSPNLRTANAVQATHRGGMFDAFVAKLNPSGSALIYSTYLGGSGEDRGLRLAIDGAGNAYITGDTESSNFPTAGPLQATRGGSVDAFVAKLNASGNQLIYSTYLGGSGIEGGTSVAVDATGSATVSGFTASANFPTVNALQQAFGGGLFDAFVAKLSATGAALDFATYLGGAGIDAGFGVAVDPAGNASLMGQTESTNFPTASPLQPVNGGGPSDLFVARIKPDVVILSAAIQGKHLIVTGSGFASGAVILVNGEPAKKTNFLSATSLRGKKAGRGIGPGQTVRIQVRNPDGILSNELSFMRPQ